MAFVFHKRGQEIFDKPVTLIQVLGVSIFTRLFNLARANLHHSHTWLGFGRFNRYFGSWVASKDKTVPGFGLAGKTVDQRLQRQLAGL